MRTRALQFTAPRTVYVDEMELPELGDADLLVRVKAVGVCFGDVATYRSQDPSIFPQRMGHEAVGIVEAVGSRVPADWKGTAVALLGQQRFSEYTVATQREAARIDISSDENWADWMVEPLACCVHGCEVANVRPGDDVAVVGCGFMGLGVIKALSLWPVSSILGVSRTGASLERAEAAGATRVVLAGDLQAEYLEVERRRWRVKPAEYLGPNASSSGHDVVFECSGSAEGLATATALTRVGGTLVLFGHLPNGSPTDTSDWHMKGLNVINATPMNAPDFWDTFQRTAHLMSVGRLSMASLVTHKYDFRQAADLFEASADQNYVKGVLTF